LIEATTDELLAYLADVVERAERYGATVQPPDRETVAWLRGGDDLIMDLLVYPPVGRRSRGVEITLQERWRPRSPDRWELTEYGYELRNQELDYRRAFHQHDVEHFVRAFGVVVHEHCEASMGNAACGHYGGEPCRGALDGLERLYVVWTGGTKPDCARLRCLE
jgi:hypothetical protein